jgi:hypothetical protein
VASALAPHRGDLGLDALVIRRCSITWRHSEPIRHAMATLTPHGKGVPRSEARLTGRWRIVAMSGWDRNAVDLVEPGFIEFAGDGTGQFGFIAVRGWLDCRAVKPDDRTDVEFTWEGVDEGDQVSGRGWATLIDDAMVEGHLFCHLGDDSSFRAEPFARADELDGQ